jgi:predicted DCC family thiol-disulfide oxidoreductase YuxK
VDSLPYILFFDGVCGLCDRLVQFVLRHDRRKRFQFAALQGAAATQTLGHYGKDPEDLDTVYVLADGKLMQKGRAVLFILRKLGFPWSLAAIFTIVPTPITDWFYDRVARSRYRIFGKLDACRLPTAEEKARFLG